mmetsp:Transcript_20134/g.60767  ORF Transcript_20134/g.60767 Transcript_20134/m.60767 type:complete len:492 (-) Transcript_20134:1012-2487(-)
MSLEDTPLATAASSREQGAAAELSSTDEETDGANCPAERPTEGQEPPAFVPRLRHGAAGDIGARVEMQDCHIGYDSYLDPAGCVSAGAAAVASHAFYGVFDGHGGTAAAHFVRHRLPGSTLEQSCFDTDTSSALSAAFLEVDREYHEQYQRACRDGEPSCSSGTTALVAVIRGNHLVVANAGDSRAVLSRAGKAVELSSDHKPHKECERRRIFAAGGTVCNEQRIGGELTVSRAIGDYHLDNLKVCRDGSLGGPLTAAPEVREHRITAADEFLLLACDGLWDVSSSQAAVNFAAAKLRQHNNAEQCAAELVQYALDLKSGDNVSVVVVCFRDEPLLPKQHVHRPGHSMLRRGARSVSSDGLNMLSDALRPAARRSSLTQSTTLPTGFPPLAPQMSSPVQLSPAPSAAEQTLCTPLSDAAVLNGSGCSAFGNGSAGSLLTSQGSLSSSAVPRRDSCGSRLSGGSQHLPDVLLLGERLRAAAIPESSVVQLTI